MSLIKENIKKYEAIYQLAIATGKSASILEKERLNDCNYDFTLYGNYMYVSVIMLKTFSCEAFIKAIMEYDNNTILKRHNLLELFNSIDSKKRDVIVDNLIKAYSNQIDKDIILEKLSEISDAFIDWRYFFENSKLNFDNIFITNFLNVLNDYTKQLFK